MTWSAGAQAAVVADAIDDMDANADVMLGWCWWACGPPAWWGGYRVTLCPTANYTADDPKMAWLQPRFAGPPIPAMRRHLECAGHGHRRPRHRPDHGGYDDHPGTQQDLVRVLRGAQRRQVQGALPGAGPGPQVVTATGGWPVRITVMCSVPLSGSQTSPVRP